MKKKVFFGLLLGAFYLSAWGQETLSESTSLVGVWQQCVLQKQEDDKVVFKVIGNYKIINNDHTFTTFVVWPNQLTEITVFGDYTIESDSTYTEKIKQHTTNHNMIGKDSPLRYEFLDRNTLLVKYYLEAAPGVGKVGRWIPEIWKRVTTSRQEALELDKQKMLW